MDTCTAVSSANRISASGKAVGGLVYVDIKASLPGQACRVRPFVWTAEGGSKLLPVPATVRNSRPTGLSDDLSMVVGWHDTFGPRLGVRWVNGQFEEFSTPEMSVGEAAYVTPDGRTVVGANAGPLQQPWVWTREGGLKLITGQGQHLPRASGEPEERADAQRPVRRHAGRTPQARRHGRGLHG